MRLDQYTTQATSVVSGNLLFLGQLINGNWVYYPVTVDLLKTFCNSGNSGGGGSYTLPIASTTTLGGVKIDGTTITINGSGVISSVSSGGTSFAPTCRVITNSTAVTVQASDNGGTIVIRQTTPAATSVTFPSGLTTGFYVTIKDGAGNAAIDPITIYPMPSATIDGQNTDIINDDRGAKTYVYDGTQLNII